MSSPSSGCLGLHLHQRSMSDLYGKLFFHYPSSPDKEKDVFTVKVTVKNSRKLVLETSWNQDFLHDVIEGTKGSIPTMTDAVLKFIDKYHTAHFGFELNRGAMKLKNTASTAIKKAYHDFPMSFNKLQNSIQHLGDQGKEMYKKSSDNLMSLRTHHINRLADKTTEVLRAAENMIYTFFDVVTQFLVDTKFTVPGSEWKFMSLEVTQRDHQAVSKTTGSAPQIFPMVIENISIYIREIEFTLPVFNVVVKGNEFMDKLQSFMRFLYDQLRKSLQESFDLFHKTFNELIQMVDEKWETFITYLHHENGKSISQVDVIHAEILNYSRQHIDEAKKRVTEYQDLIKLNFQKIYNVLNIQHVNNNVKDVISIFQSHLCGGLNEAINVMRRTSQSTAPYINVTNTNMNIEIPLPFLWKLFNEWPKPSVH
ncbi:apolipoprotein B-100-like [Antennarius striatus]|uniref:apolipoprotein B-100-like n=1 Tax=Antennarius striatus TaxID=241820 RepID=UPI0035B42984